MPLRREILLEPGDVLYREGDPNDCAYLIESGEIVLYSNLIGRRIDCERRGPGSIVGELSILTGQPRAVTVEAVTRCKAFRISADQILARFEKLDPVLRACIETSISFSATFTEQLRNGGDEAPFAPSTLRNATGLIEQFKLEADILKGLDRDEFFLEYQPIMCLSQGRIVGVEALMRWQHAAMGRVPPERFIAFAEGMGVIDKLTEFALSEACAALLRMKDYAGARETFFISVNVSGQDIGRAGFVDFVAFLLDCHDVLPGSLRLEVTETALVAGSEHAEKHLQQLRSLGCGLSIDDFGTGYSNLAYLKTLPLTALKIDRVFAGDAHMNEVSRSIVRMLLGLGKELGVDIIAEGLETVEAADTLRELGCDLVQGFYFSKPRAEAEICDLIASRPGKRQSVA